MKETKLAQHKRNKKVLSPPFTEMNFTKSSWVDDRLPDFLWAILIVSSMPREEYLQLFRYIAKIAQDNKISDMTVSNIGALSIEQRQNIIKRILLYSPEIKEILRPMSLFESLPGREEWMKELGESKKEDVRNLALAVEKNWWHQSQEATDCRWAAVLSSIAGGKTKFTKKTGELGKLIVEYPKDEKEQGLGSRVRAFEMGLRIIQEKNSWPSDFWKELFDKTDCIPEEEVNKKIEERQEVLRREIEDMRNYYLEPCINIRNSLITHYFSTMKVSSRDEKHEAVFGLALYAMTLFIETNFYRMAQSISARLNIRTLLEIFITLKFMEVKEKEEPEIWKTFRDYGTGQFKLIMSKVKEGGLESNMVNLVEISYIANEDQWVEFTTINLGNWSNMDLRKMAEESGLKGHYDRYYDYCSAYTHGNWGAIRETVFQNCVNPLHRWHRVPIYDLPLLESVQLDAEEILNEILKLVGDLYEGFNERLDYKQELEKAEID